MNNLLNLHIEHAELSAHERTAIVKSLEHTKSALEDALFKAEYVSSESFMFTPFDEFSRSRVSDLAKKKRELNPSLVVLIGIGGSNLGALAIHQALYGTLYNDRTSGPRLYCADTVDEKQLDDILAISEGALKKKETVLVIIASKSGKTLETLVNAQFFIELLKRYHPERYQDYIVTITDDNSPLWWVAKEYGFSLLPIPAAVGGRYSLFTSVGLFPLALLGVDIDLLCAGARDVARENAELSAAAIYYNWAQGLKIHNMFLFSPRLQLLGAWYRQLMGESLGKRADRDGKEVHVGITPTVSIGSTDLHSVVQLYLGGQRDTFTTFVIAPDENSREIPLVAQNPLPEYVVGKSVMDVKNAILKGVQASYVKESRPFMTVDLEAYTPQALGAFCYLKMIEMAYLGYLLNVNPYDQPEVESYKIETKRLLSHE